MEFFVIGFALYDLTRNIHLIKKILHMGTNLGSTKNTWRLWQLLTMTLHDLSSPSSLLMFGVSTNKANPQLHFRKKTNINQWNLISTASQENYKSIRQYKTQSIRKMIMLFGYCRYLKWQKKKFQIFRKISLPSQIFQKLVIDYTVLSSLNQVYKRESHLF